MFREYTYVKPETGEEVYVDINVHSCLVEDLYAARGSSFVGEAPGVDPRHGGARWGKKQNTLFWHAIDPQTEFGRLLDEGYVCSELEYTLKK